MTDEPTDGYRYREVYQCRKMASKLQYVVVMARLKEKPLPRLEKKTYRRQAAWRHLPCELAEIPVALGYFVTDGFLHYRMKQTHYVMSFRKPNKTVNEKYIRHLARENGWHIR